MRVDTMENDERKQNLYFPEEMLEEMAAEAARQGCSLSVIVQRAWIAAREEINALPSPSGPSKTD
jgi:uncharacterized small protein (TIGR04563 family)